ncbi:acetate uptake transporter [Jeongeupia naejangsanensis]|uniref:Acetate uptake transporter n=1 Tax=Jeongeupia naejangsanensis TaxID=613195 RepID=A0ABS2BGK4_9NEIS|nr:acetate uptake transporter [Jeongeupia naejangsanensis]MBM3114748.1 acetate uptake transporter [Jeongeupia naejangsanensis]
MTDIQLVQTKDTTANPAPLGLLGFGMTTVLLNVHNVGWIPLGSMILAMGLFYGGLAQVIAGVMEWKKGNTFGTVAFTSYGMFWLSLVALLVMPKLGWVEAQNADGMGAYMLMWGLFTLCLFVGTLRASLASRVVFGTLTILFFLLAAAEFTGSVALTRCAGVVGLVCGASAFYTAIAEVLNETYGRTVLPLGGN